MTSRSRHHSPRLPALLAGLMFVLAATGGAATETSSPPAARGSTIPKALFGLDTLYREFQDYRQPAETSLGGTPPTPFASQRTMARVVGQRVVIDAVAKQDAEALKADLLALGAEVTAIAGRLVSARLPIDQIPRLADLATLQFARPAVALRHSGPALTQGDHAQLSDSARTAFGVDGTGITVGVLSDSFSCNVAGYQDDLAHGELPPNVGILLDHCPASDKSGKTDEGRAMAQIIHDVAPGARILFRTGWDGEAEMAQQIRAFSVEPGEAGARVIVDDVIHGAEPMFQDGVIAQAVDAAAALGIAYFSAAGNEGRDGYAAAFLDSGQSGNNGARHDFDPGAGTDPLLNLWLPRGTTLFVLQWDDPFYSVSGPPGAAANLDLFLYTSDGQFIEASDKGCNLAGRIVVGGCERTQGGDALDFFQYENSGPARELALSIELAAGPPPAHLRLVVFFLSEDGKAFRFLDHYSGVGASTLYGHANAAGANAVGATSFLDTPVFGKSPPCSTGTRRQASHPFCSIRTGTGFWKSGASRNSPRRMAAIPASLEATLTRTPIPISPAPRPPPPMPRP